MSCSKEEFEYTPDGCSNYCGKVVDREITYAIIDGNFETLYFIYVQQDNCPYVRQIQLNSTDYFLNQVGVYYCNINQTTI